ncbi:hypothetical protein MIZ03_1541 [Rhodoferax lithotrophicus]|uniref:Alkaline phytoceramidase n=1 Tax=Rhodoferax lithotrophicus TaxID=2798804 RepID=A0ABM7MKC9_9BURK|nr:hypothetical protein [Rhodoferax sp. MIZ03]BCO26658.1 hypothetical protein MIZ03_1541 [Rhodoferax sp. MIZ03]
MKALSSSALSHPALSRPEQVLLAALLAALALAAWGPSVAQHAQYHAFADQRGWHGLPCAMDVLTNLPFAVVGLWGLVRLWQASLQRSLNDHWQLAAVFFGGLLVTAAGSSYYHWQPDNHGLAWDRLGMVVAFAGLLGMAVAERISLRAGVATLAATLLAGPVAVLVWYQTGDLLPWVVVQAGGMLLLLALALRQPTPDGWGLSLAPVVALYTLAKLLELGDHSVFGWTGGLVSGHSLKHVVAALAAWPVIAVMHNHPQFRLHQAAKVWA